MTSVNSSNSINWNVASTPTSVQSLVSELSPSESAEFVSMLGQIYAGLQQMGQVGDSYEPPTSGGSSPITSEYEAMSPSEQSDFNDFVNQIVSALQSSDSTTTNSASATGSTGGVQDTSSSPLQQMQYWEDKYEQDWSSPSTQAQAGQDWQNYLAAAQSWQQGGATETGESTGSLSYTSGDNDYTTSNDASTDSLSTDYTQDDVATSGDSSGTISSNSSFTASTGANGVPDGGSTSLTLSPSANSALQALKPEIDAAAQATGVPADLIAAVIWQESKGDTSVSGTTNPETGLQDGGVMQVDSATAAQLEKDYPSLSMGSLTGTAQNIMEGAAYLKQMYDQFGSWDKAERAYNSGPNDPSLSSGNLNDPSGGTDPNYVDKVQQWWSDISTGSASSLDGNTYTA